MKKSKNKVVRHVDVKKFAVRVDKIAPDTEKPAPKQPLKKRLVGSFDDAARHAGKLLRKRNGT